MKAVRALTVRQPWADAIAYAGKRVENRSWVPTRIVPGDRLLIHSALKADRVEGVPVGLPGVRGAVIAVATLAGVHPGQTCRCSEWSESTAWHWVLSDVSPLVRPVPCAGGRRLWMPSEDVLAQVGELS